MIDESEVPTPPPDRGLPDHRRRREELLMKIDPDERHMSLGRRWGLPMGVAAGVAALGVTAAVAFGGGASTNTVTVPLGPGALASSTAGTAAGAATGAAGTSTGSAATATGAVHTAPAGPAITPLPTSADGPPQIDPTAPVITTGGGQPLAADRVGRILASCLGSDASKYHAVIAVSTAIKTKGEDGYVIAADGSGRFAECSALGDVGRPENGASDAGHLPTQAGGAVQLWNSGTDFNTPGADGVPTSYLMVNSGRVSSAVARVTVSYGTESQQYPAILKDGVFLLTVSTPYHANDSHPPIGWVHAFDASGHELYNETTDPVANGSAKK